MSLCVQYNITSSKTRYFDRKFEILNVNKTARVKTDYGIKPIAFIGLIVFSPSGVLKIFFLALNLKSGISVEQ